MNDLHIIDSYDEKLHFEPVNRDVFQIYVQYKNKSILIQPTMEDAIKIRDWLANLIIENQE